VLLESFDLSSVVSTAFSRRARRPRWRDWIFAAAASSSGSDPVKTPAPAAAVSFGSLTESGADVTMIFQRQGDPGTISSSHSA
jgi:hypothetical protein